MHAPPSPSAPAALRLLLAQHQLHHGILHARNALMCCMKLTGGTLAVTFWPSHVEDKGPWQRLADLTTNKPKLRAVSHQSLPATVSNQTYHSNWPCNLHWPQSLVAAVAAHCCPQHMPCRRHGAASESVPLLLGCILMLCFSTEAANHFRRSLHM